MVITEQLKDSMIKLKEEGKTFVEIANILNLSYSTVRYNLDSKIKEIQRQRSKETYKKLSREKKREYAINHREYIKNYEYKKYHSDEVFRNKMIQANILSRKKRVTK